MSDQKPYETRDISGKAVEVFGLGLALTIALVMVLVGGMFIVMTNLANEHDTKPLGWPQAARPRSRTPG